MAEQNRISEPHERISKPHYYLGDAGRRFSDGCFSFTVPYDLMYPNHRTAQVSSEHIEMCLSLLYASLPKNLDAEILRAQPFYPGGFTGKSGVEIPTNRKGSGFPGDGFSTHFRWGSGIVDDEFRAPSSLKREQSITEYFWKSGREFGPTSCDNLVSRFVKITNDSV